MSHPVLISGGSGGIGSALCLRFSAAGYTPYVGYARNREAAEQTARRCAGVALALDLTDDSAIDAALAKIVDAAPDLAGVVLAASPPPRLAPLAQISSGEMESAWRVGVSGPQRLLAGLVRDVFRKTRRGTIVGVLSEAMGNGRGVAMKGMGA